MFTLKQKNPFKNFLSTKLLRKHPNLEKAYQLIFSSILFGDLNKLFELLSFVGPDKSRNDNIKKPLFFSAICPIIPSMDLLVKIKDFVKNKRIIEIGAYRGFISKCLKILGLDIITTKQSNNNLSYLQTFSSNFPVKRFNGQTFSKINLLNSSQLINKDGADVLLIIASSFQFEYECLKAFKGSKVIYIGDKNYRSTFFNELSKNWEIENIIELSNWDDTENICYFYSRKLVSEYYSENKSNIISVTPFNPKITREFDILNENGNLKSVEIGVNVSTMGPENIGIYYREWIANYSNFTQNEKGFPLIDIPLDKDSYSIIICPKEYNDFPFIFVYNKDKARTMDIKYFQESVNLFFEKISKSTNYYFSNYYNSKINLDLIVVGKNLDDRKIKYIYEKLIDFNRFRFIDIYKFKFPFNKFNVMFFAFELYHEKKFFYLKSDDEKVKELIEI